jgi:hypothetical protein
MGTRITGITAMGDTDMVIPRNLRGDRIQLRNVRRGTSAMSTELSMAHAAIEVLLPHLSERIRI